LPAGVLPVVAFFGLLLLYMKKLFAVLLMLVYGVTSFGMTLHLHYCCGKVDKISLSYKGVTNGTSETFIHSKGCCDSKEYELKIKADQEAGPGQIILLPHHPVIAFAAYTFHLPDFQKIPVNFLSTGPPVISRIPLFIQYCIYRI